MHLPLIADLRHRHPQERASSMTPRYLCEHQWMWRHTRICVPGKTCGRWIWHCCAANLGSAVLSTIYGRGWSVRLEFTCNLIVSLDVLAREHLYIASFCREIGLDLLTSIPSSMSRSGEVPISFLLNLNNSTIVRRSRTCHASSSKTPWNHEENAPYVFS